jgi:hypothetical protein
VKNREIPHYSSLGPDSDVRPQASSKFSPYHNKKNHITHSLPTPVRDARPSAHIAAARLHRRLFDAGVSGRRNVNDEQYR